MIEGIKQSDKTPLVNYISTENSDLSNFNYFLIRKYGY